MNSYLAALATVITAIIGVAGSTLSSKLSKKMNYAREDALWARLIKCEHEIATLTVQLASTKEQLKRCNEDSIELKQKYDTLILEVDLLKK